MGASMLPGMWTADAGPGCADTPGTSHLVDVDPLLWVGNEVAASQGNPLTGKPYDVVISTVRPRDWSQIGGAAPHLTTHAVFFQDGQGGETKEGIATAKRCILEGAALVSSSV